MNDFGDTLAGKSLFPEATLDVIEHARVGRVGLVKDALQREVRLAEPITEVLCEDPSAVYACAARSLV